MEVTIGDMYASVRDRTILVLYLSEYRGQIQRQDWERRQNAPHSVELRS